MLKSIPPPPGVKNAIAYIRKAVMRRIPIDTGNTQNSIGRGADGNVAEWHLRYANNAGCLIRREKTDS